MLIKNCERQGFGADRVVGAPRVLDDLIGFDSPPVASAEADPAGFSGLDIDPHDEKKKRWRRHG
jgi:hypothetical protein